MLSKILIQQQFLVGSKRLRTVLIILMSVKTIGPLLREENYLIFLYFFLGRAQRGAVSHSVLGTSIKFDIALPVWNRRDDHLFLFFLSLPTNETCTVEIVFNLSKYATNIISRYIWYSKGNKTCEKRSFTHLISRYLSRFFECLAHPNRSATLATDQKWPF